VKKTFLILSILGLVVSQARAADIEPPPDPISQASEALGKARSALRSTSKKGTIKPAEAYAAILTLRQVAEAYAAKGDPRQAGLYYQETLKSLRALAKAAPSFQTADVTRQITEVEAAIAAVPVATTEEKTIQVELASAALTDGQLRVEWLLHPPDLTANEIERHLNFTVAVKLSDGSTLKKLKPVKILFYPNPDGTPNTYRASQDYVCPATAKSVLLGVEFFDVNVFQQNQTL
jgi:hypothetical protein